MAGLAALGALTEASPAADGWTLSLARPEDDAGVRALLRRSVIPGGVRVAFTREPSDAAGAGLAGSVDVTLVARRGAAIRALGRCSVQSLHRNGQLQRFGYLSALRVLPGTPSSARLLRDGYAMLAEAATGAAADGFVTAIASDNARARRVLEHGHRFGLPEYRALASLVTLVAPVARGGREQVGRGRSDHERALEHTDGANVSLDELTGFLQSHAPRAHLTLSWDAARWASLAAHGVSASNVCVIRRDGRLRAAAAIWDQRAFRQTIIDGYEGATRLWRPAINALQRVRGLPALPAPGSSLAQGALLGVTVPDARDWPALWSALQRRARASALAWLTVARDAGDPQLAALQRLTRARTYSTTLYDVAWRDRRSWRDAWDARGFAPEAGLL